MAIQFCKFQETLFREVVIDEFYYQLKYMHFFVTPCIVDVAIELVLKRYSELLRIYYLLSLDHS
jgi:uncharacterized protein involved in tolerance to divalent cations